MLYLLLLIFLGQGSPGGVSCWTLSIGLRSWERKVICVPFISVGWEVRAVGERLIRCTHKKVVCMGKVTALPCFLQYAYLKLPLF